MKITLNREYAVRHLFVVVLLLGLSGWFGFDGFVRYPQVDAAALYESIEGEPPPPAMSAEALARFKSQKTDFQRLFALALLVGGVVVGLRLLQSARFALTFDDAGFELNGVRYSYADVQSVDAGKWEKERIARVTLPGRKFVLDGWHHTGVKEFYEKLKTPVDSSKKI